MAKTCTVPSPEQMRFRQLRDASEEQMLETIFAAIEHAADKMAERLRSEGIDLAPTDKEYFNFVAQQKLFVRLCGGDLDTYQDGDAKIADGLIANYDYISSQWRGQAGDGIGTTTS